MNAPVQIGEVLAGKYRVERVLGAGGMGVVVAARHLQLDERVAIKFLQPAALKDPSLIARFLREGRAAVKIRNEHVARVYDVGNLDSGAPYLVMEYLEGSDLAAFVKARGPLPMTTAVDYVLQACEAIAEAHVIGIVHRDFKPANLFLTTQRDGSQLVKVIDFGISKISAGAGDGLDITKTVEARGSPLFMSPEQMASPRDVGAPSDLWAIGVSLHNLLTTTYPFHAQTLTELCGMVLQGDPTPLRACRPDLPVGLESVILRCLRKKPAERYADVAELATALGEFAPPLAQLSVDRIHRLLHGSAPRDRGPLPSKPAIHPAPAHENREDVTTRRLATPSPANVVESPVGAQAQPDGSSSWGSTKLLFPKRSRAMLAVLGLVGGAAAAVVVIPRLVQRSPAPAEPQAAASPEVTAVAHSTQAIGAAPAPGTLSAPSPSVERSGTSLAIAPAPSSSATRGSLLMPVSRPSAANPPKQQRPAKTEIF